MNKPEILIKERELISDIPCETRRMSDTERLMYGKPRPNTEDLRRILQSPKLTRQYQNTYGVSDTDIVAIRNCISQQVYEKNLYAKAEESAVSKELPFDDIEEIPMGLHGEAIIIGR